MRKTLIFAVTLFAMFWPTFVYADDPVPPTTTKICQLTGEEDRQFPRNPTGSVLGGETGGITGTDMGYPFEYQRRLYFLFGDSREFPPDRCEPAWCGTDNAPIPVLQPEPENVQRWRSNVEWDTWERIRGEGSDSMATASLSFDPEDCIPLKFEAVGHDGVFAHTVVGNTIAPAIQLGGPPVAANPQDKWVLVMDNRILVITDEGDVFAHAVIGNTIAEAYQLPGPKVAARPEDKWVLAMGNRLLVITKDGRVFAHPVNDDTIGDAFQLEGPNVAANPQDKWVLAMGDRLLVVTNDGSVFAHQITDNIIGPLSPLNGPPVAANPQDTWLLIIGQRLLVITEDGGVFVHEVSSNSVDAAFKMSGPSVAANWQDIRVLVMDNRLLVGTARRFRPTRLDGEVVGRDEGAITAFVDGRRIYSFFTLRDKPLGCLADLPGCSHGGEEPGGQSVLSMSTDGGRNFRELLPFSKTKFLWPVPEVTQASKVPGLPADMRGRVVLVWGAGREKNALDPEVDGRVFTHEMTGNIIGVPSRLRGPMVAANTHDKWVLTTDNRLMVITKDGQVFVHDVVGDTIAPAFQLGGSNVAANPQDKWVLAMGSRLLVVTEKGDVYVHDVVGNTIAPAYQLDGPKVAANPQDKWLLTMGNRLLVVTEKGNVYVHNVVDNTIAPAYQLDGPKVAANPQDKWLIAMGNRLLVVTENGDVFAHTVIGDTIVPAFQLAGPKVASRPEDQWLLAMDNRLLVITSIPVSQWNHSYPYLAVAPLSSVGSKNAWRYFAGFKEDGQPDWQASEALAQPLPPSDPSQNGNGYHQCLGYFSVRFIEGLSKWAMLYTCNDIAAYGYNSSNGPRGIYLRTAATPWGPWSHPQRVFDPDDAYCRYMHDQRGDESNYCLEKGTNPAEESVRDTTTPGVTKRGSGGEYMPILLPSRYAKVSAAGTTLYFLMATWNPYQVVLMKTELATMTADRFMTMDGGAGQ